MLGRKRQAVSPRHKVVRDTAEGWSNLATQANAADAELSNAKQALSTARQQATATGRRLQRSRVYADHQAALRHEAEAESRVRQAEQTAHETAERFNTVVSAVSGERAA